MRVLHGLKLNCLLVPLVQVVCGLLALLVFATLSARAVGEREVQVLTRQVAAAARLPTPLDPPALRDLLRPHDGTPGIAIVDVGREDMVLTVTVREGPTSLVTGREAGPELVLAGLGPHRWHLRDGRIAIAAPLAETGGRLRLLYLEIDPPPRLPATTPWAIPGGIAILGLLLALYLLRHIYHPVRGLIAQTELAVAEGRTVPPRVYSEETAALSSLISSLTMRQALSDARPCDPSDAE